MNGNEMKYLNSIQINDRQRDDRTYKVLSPIEKTSD